MKENIRDKNENHKIEQYKIKKLNVIKKKNYFFSCKYKNVRDNKKKLS